MCGLFGKVASGEIDCVELRGTLETLSHRGPDLRSDWSEGGVFIGHARLSIIDLSLNGRQPMVDHENSCVITVNGEIYNYRSLRRALLPRHKFGSDSDSEVVLHGFKEWGIRGLLDRLEGIYAITIYDRKNEKLYLARDRVGVKPLYYTNGTGEFLWASELKAIVDAVGENNLLVDHTAVYDYLTYKYIPTPKTVYKDVFKLRPGHFLEFDRSKNSFVEFPYWALNTEAVPIDTRTASEKLLSLADNAVDSQMVSDVPVGFFLSGGIDSSSVVACASRHRSDLMTFSIGFDDISFSETPFARMVAEKFQTNHKEKLLSSKNSQALYSKMRTWFDEPFGDNSALPTYLVSKTAAEDVTVVLTGDGGDEIFGGYKWYEMLPDMENKDWRPPKLLTQFLASVYQRYPYKHIGRLARRVETELMTDRLALHTRLLSGMTREEKEPVRQALEIPRDYDDYWYLRSFDRPELPPRSRLQFIDFHTFLPDDILTKVDRTSMAVSIEARVPLLDTKLIEFAFSLPEEVRYHKYGLKGLMKMAMSDMLPSKIVEREKRGFSIPPINSLKKAICGTLPWHYELLKEQFQECLPDKILNPKSAA